MSNQIVSCEKTKKANILIQTMADRWEAQSCLSTDITRGAGDDTLW